MAAAVTLALPAIGQEFNAGAVQLGWVITGYILSMGVFILPFGRLGDIIGRRKVLMAGLYLFTISTCLIALSQNITFMIVFRIIQGFSSAMIFGTNMAVLSTVFQAGERGRAMGITSTFTYLAAALGPVIGGIFTQYLSWRSIFIFPLPFQIVSILIITLKIKTPWEGDAGQKYDWKGSIVYGFSLFGLIYGFSNLPALTGWICLAAGIVLAIVFIFMELRINNPLFEIRLIISNKAFAFSSAAAFINFACTNAIGFFFSLYLQYLKGFDARTAGLILIAQPFAIMLTTPIAGRLSDRKNPEIIASIGMGIISLCLVMLCFINSNTHMLFLIAVLFIIGIGFGLFVAPNSNAIMSSVQSSYLGLASGALGTMRMIGQSMSMAIVLMLISIFIGNEVITPAIYPSLLLVIRMGFLVFAALSAIGILVSLAGKKSVIRKH